MSPLEPSLKRDLIELAFEIRNVEEALLDLFREGHLHGTVHTCVGQEFAAACLATQLEKRDFIFSNHRGHGHYIGLKRNSRGLMAELMGRADGICGGWGGSQHLFDEGFFSNGIQGSGVPVSLGLAFARKLKGAGGLGVVFLGDGTLGEGVVYEGLNLARLWSLPLLFVVEDNGIAQTTPIEEALAGSVEARARAFDLRFYHGDTWNWESLYQTAGQALQHIREHGSPGLLHIKTYRLKAHSKGDDTRPPEEVKGFERRDPVTLLSQEPEWKARFKESRDKIRSISEDLKANPNPARLLNDKLKDKKVSWDPTQVPDGFHGQLLNQAFKKFMAQYEDTLFVGEDVKSPYGGAFKISKDLSDLWPGRVFQTPISEATLIGLGTGLAIEKFRPFVEIMFGDFLTLGFDQIVNSAAKFQSMYNQKVCPNFVIRTPMGGRRGYGPTHSQSLEKHFLGVPGLRVLMMNPLLEAFSFLDALMTSSSGPNLLIENKANYGLSFLPLLPEGFKVFRSNHAVPHAAVVPDGRTKHVSLVSSAGMLAESLKAVEVLFRRHEIICQILCPSQLYPFRVEELQPWITEAPRVLFLEEGPGFSSFSSECLSQMGELGWPQQGRRLTATESVIPSARHLEAQIIPDAEAIVASITSWLKQ